MKKLNEISVKLAGNYIKAATSKIKELVKAGRGKNLSTIKKRSAGITKAKSSLFNHSTNTVDANPFNLSKKGLDIANRYQDRLTKAMEADWADVVEFVPRNNRYGPDGMVKWLSELDPTKKQEDYLEFIVKTYSGGDWGTLRREEITELLTTFNTFKAQLAIKDINKYARVEDVEEAMRGKLLLPSKKYLVRMKKIQGTKIIVDTPEFKAIRLFKHEAVKYYCAGTKWCLTQLNHFDTYTRNDAHMMIIIAKLNGVFRKFAWSLDNMLITNEKDIQLTGDGSEFRAIRDLPQFKVVEKYLADTQSPLNILRYIEFAAYRKFPLGERKIATDPQASYEYAVDVLHDRFPLGEKAIATSGSTSVQYNQHFNAGVGIKAMAKYSERAYEYAFYVLHGRFLEGEKAILKDPDTIMRYIKKVVMGPWPEAEPILAKYTESAIEYAMYIKKAFPAGEKAIAKSGIRSYQYAGILRKRFPAGEKAIAQDADLASDYIINFIHGPWKLGEPAISHHSYYASDYAIKILKKPWPMGETAIARMSSPARSYYDFLVLNGFNKQAAAFAAKSPHI